MDEKALERCFISPNVCDSNGENANVVDALQHIGSATGRIAEAIFPSGVGTAQDASGGTIASLTESVMGVTAGLFEVASAIRYLADSKQADS